MVILKNVSLHIPKEERFENLNMVSIITMHWILGQACINSNKEADKLAKERSATKFVGPELEVRVVIKQMISSKHHKR